MADESRDTGLLPEVARPWVDALRERFGSCVESRLIEAARPLVVRYLDELGVKPKTNDDRERYVVRVAVALAYHWLEFVKRVKTEDPPRSNRGEYPRE